MEHIPWGAIIVVGGLAAAAKYKVIRPRTAIIAGAVWFVAVPLVVTGGILAYAASQD